MQRSLAGVVMTLICLTSEFGMAAEPTHRDVEYARVGEHRLLLDLYMPPQSSKPAPLVVWIHGGAWRAGSKDSVPVERWLQQGFAIASVEYRLSPVAKFPAQIHDIKAAIRWLRGNANSHGTDPSRFIIAGSSAGGHLAALVGVSNGVKALEGDSGDFTSTSSDVQAIISFFGASNLESILSQSTPHGLSVRVPALELLLGGQPNQKRELAKLASPLMHVAATDPPLWLIHGDADPQMPVEQSHELQTRYVELGLKVDLEIVKDGKHGGEGFFTDKQLDRIAQQLKADVNP
ncbi:MAG: alpha/beta hydrolase [Planctomycetota bacterium]|nr:alpha/beta hydrolase [Planctomycetota bacterium]